MAKPRDDVRKRRERAMELKSMGLGWAAIARQIVRDGYRPTYDRSDAFKDVKRGLRDAALRKRQADSAVLEEMMLMGVRRNLFARIQANNPRLLSDDFDERIAAERQHRGLVAEIHKNSDRMVKLLGLEQRKLSAIPEPDTAVPVETEDGPLATILKIA